MTLRHPTRSELSREDSYVREQHVETSLQRARREQRSKERRELFVILCAMLVIGLLCLYGAFCLWIRH
jgi:hypothetical protein